MKLSKEAKKGFESGCSQLNLLLNNGVSPVEALKKIGIDGLVDTWCFLSQLKEYKKYKLLKRLTS